MALFELAYFYYLRDLDISQQILGDKLSEGLARRIDIGMYSQDYRALITRCVPLLFAVLASTTIASIPQTDNR
jgi:hypothetical protein